MRTRMCCIRMSWVSISIPARMRVMPGEGAVCPAIVRKGSAITSGFMFRSMTPATSNTTIRGPLVSIAARNEPGPSGLRLVTRRILPPRPAGVSIPKPCAPGKTGGAATNGSATTLNRSAWTIRIISPFGLPLKLETHRRAESSRAGRIERAARPRNVRIPADPGDHAIRAGLVDRHRWIVVVRVIQHVDGRHLPTERHPLADPEHFENAGVPDVRIRPDDDAARGSSEIRARRSKSGQIEPLIDASLPIREVAVAEDIRPDGDGRGCRGGGISRARRIGPGPQGGEEAARPVGV